MKPLTVYDSEEKKWVREKLWKSSVRKILKDKKSLKILELLSDSSDFWWDSFFSGYPRIEYSMNGVTLDKKTKTLKGRVFRGHYSCLLKKKDFLNSFPYDVINLDYYGGGRFFNPKFRSQKTKEINETIRQNLKSKQEFCLLLTLEINDKIYPWYKESTDVILTSPIKKEVEEFLEGIKNSDSWNIWLALMGNPFELLRYAIDEGCDLKLLYPPFTYIGESTGHRSRMLSFSFFVTHFSRENSIKRYSDLFSKIKRTHFVKWSKKGIVENEKL